MSIPNVSLTVQDGGLGILPANTSNVLVTLGVCSKGTPNQLYGLSDLTAAVQTLGYGPLTEALALKLQTGGSGSVQYVMPLTPASSGAASTVTKNAIGGDVTVTFGPLETITFDVVLGGLRGVAQFTYKIGSGLASDPIVIPANGVYAVPNTLTTVTFGAGTYDAGDEAILAPTGVITAAWGDTGSMTQVSQPCDTYSARIQVVGAGSPGTGSFKYSLDYRVDSQGNDVSTYSPSIRIPAGFKYAIPNTGVVVVFSSNPFYVNDKYTFRVVPPGFTSTEVLAAFTALLALNPTWGGVHVVGVPASASAAYTLAAAIDSDLATAFAANRFAFGLSECPTVGSIIPPSAAVDSADTDSTCVAAFANLNSIRMMVGAGDAFVVSPISGWTYRRNAAWLAGARLSLVPIGEDLARFARGALTGVQALARDEGLTPALDAGRFITLRSFPGQAGFYITNGHIMSGSTSDYQYSQAIRVIDRACEIAYAGALRYLSAGVRVNANTGFIDERDAKAIESDISEQLVQGLVSTGQASAARAQLSRTTNLLSNPNEPMTVVVTPLGYLKSISITIGLGLIQNA